MVLVDTSVWIDHLRRREPVLAQLLSDGLVLMHPFVSGELACGSMQNRPSILSGLHALPSAELASNSEVLSLIEDRRLWGRGLGWVDTHLLASALLSNCAFWTLDVRLAKAAAELDLSPIA
jgi:predicted nucleic acid-binding protein